MTTHPPVHNVSIRLCERCMSGRYMLCTTDGCALRNFGDGTTLDTSPALADFHTDPATGLDTRTTNDTGRKEP